MPAGAGVLGVGVGAGAAPAAGVRDPDSVPAAAAPAEPAELEAAPVPAAVSGRLERFLVEALPLEGRRRPYRLTDAGLAALRGRLSGLNAAVSIGLARVGNR